MRDFQFFIFCHHHGVWHTGQKESNKRICKKSHRTPFQYTLLVILTWSKGILLEFWKFQILTIIWVLIPRHTVPKGCVRLFGVAENGKDIFSLHTSPKLDIKLNQNPKSSCTSKDWWKAIIIFIIIWQLDLAFRRWNLSLIWHVWMIEIKKLFLGTPNNHG